MANYDRILVFGAHHDDELTMACTMANFVAEGTQVYVCIMTDGCEGYPRPEMKDTIAEVRSREADACDQVIGITKRFKLNSPDMALVNDKETLLKCVQIIREVKPDAIFTHGPHDNHRDHLNTHAITVQARWHAGQPVAADMGPSWTTPHLYYYKGLLDRSLPCIQLDVTATAEKRPEALATQVSQHTLFRRTKEDFLADAERIKRDRPRTTDTFWIAPKNQFSGLLPKGL